MKTILQQEQINRLHEFGFDAVRLTDLLSILPKKISDRRRIYELRMGVTDCICADEQWYVEYKDSHNDMDELESFQAAEELIDAIFDMIVWIRTNEFKAL